MSMRELQFELNLATRTAREDERRLTEAENALSKAKKKGNSDLIRKAQDHVEIVKVQLDKTLIRVGVLTGKINNLKRNQ